jgi:alginate O-acetyltransferase complex protein AlgJ
MNWFQTQPLRTFVLTMLGLCSGVTMSFSDSVAQSQPSLTIGQDSFVFDRLNDLKGYSQNAVKRVDGALEIVAQINRVLAEQKVQLTVVLVPSARRIYAEHLPSSFKTTEELQGLYTHSMQALRAEGVFVPDLQQAFLQAKASAGTEFPLYMRQDNHWSTAGALEAAKVIATDMGSKWVSELDGLPEYTSTYEWLAPVLYEGNFYRKLSKDDQAKIVQDHLRPIKFNHQAGGDLLGTETPGVTLVGSSFSHLKEFGFAEGLAHFLHRDVLNAAESGKGFWTPLVNYLSSDAYAETPPKILIWEIPEDQLAPGYPPIDWADPWARRQYMLEVSANIAACGNGIEPIDFESVDFTGDASSTQVVSSTSASLVKYGFAEPIRNDQYLSVQVTSAKADSFVIKNDGLNPQKYTAKINGYGIQHRINAPLALQSDGTNRSVSVSVAPGNDLKLEAAQLCTMPVELNKWANPSK